MSALRGLIAVGVICGAACAPLACSADNGVPERYVAGEHYTVLDKPAPTKAQNGRIEVIEFFLYSCPHCYHFDPTIRKWIDKLPKDVAFRRVPVTFSGGGPHYARIFYTAKDLGAFKHLHSAIFRAIHEDNKPLAATANIRAFFVAHGFDGAAFDKTYNSDRVKAQVRRATALMQAYGVVSVPSMGVAGKYWISGRQAGTNPAMLKVADFLVNKERENR